MGWLSRPVPVVGAGVISARGHEWRGLGCAVESGASVPAPSKELAESHPGTRSFEVEALPEPRTVGEKRARLLMSRSAVLASAATETALRDAGWSEAPERVGYYLGVGASGGAVDQLTAMLAASIEEREFSLARFGDEGLRACNPLFAFQLMNNFTLCHSAILHGTQGPNAAFFSRGSGTVVALLEAVHAVLDNESDRVLAGGADSSVHSVTWAELLREGWAERGLVPGEGASILALGEPSPSSPALGFVDYISVRACRVKTVAQALAEVRGEMGASTIDAVLLAPWGPPAREALLSFAADALSGRVVLDVTLALGESLAASPALAWAVALDLLAVERLHRVLVLSAGLDGDLGVVTIRSGGRP